MYTSNERPKTAWEEDLEALMALHRTKICKRCFGKGILWYIPETYYASGMMEPPPGPVEVNCHFCDRTGYAQSPEQI